MTENFFIIFQKKACIFGKDVLLYRGAEGFSKNLKIRVWRSLVSRLNGVQEASSSNLDTRTKMEEKSLFSYENRLFSNSYDLRFL